MSYSGGPQEGTGFLWQSRKRQKMPRQFGGRGSQTAGKTKGENCQASPFQKWCAANSRSYKHPRYLDVLQHWAKQNQTGAKRT
jgi:hypothetical protein